MSMASTLDNWRLHGFHGGILPPEFKWTAEIESRAMPIAQTLYFPLRRRNIQLDAVVEPGTKVLAGTVLAVDPDGRQAPIIAPTSGEVMFVDAIQPPVANPMDVPGISLRPDGMHNFVSSEPQTLTEVLNTEREVLLTKIHHAGIIGMGGAGFPTAAKLRTSNHVPTVVLNGAECEPFITSDDRLMQEYALEILSGGWIIAKITGAERIIVAIEDNKPKAIDAIRNARDTLNCTLPIHVVSLPTRYPSGGEKQLIENLTGRQIANNQLPASMGFVIHNVGTAKAIYDACVHGHPLTNRLVTVTGDAIEHPGNYWVMLGTPIRFILEHVGADLDKLAQIVHGGPMMGWDIIDLETPIDATTNCLIAASTALFPPPPPPQPCIRCGLCVEACPAQLLPQELLFHIKSEQYDRAHALQLDQCIECGACSYVCPSHIPLVDYYRFGKAQWREIQRKNEKAEQSRQRHERKLARLARLEAEKKARRQQRAAKATGPNEDKKKLIAEAVARVRAKKQAQGPTNEEGQEP